MIVNSVCARTYERVLRQKNIQKFLIDRFTKDEEIMVLGHNKPY